MGYTCYWNAEENVFEDYIMNARQNQDVMHGKLRDAAVTSEEGQRTLLLHMAENGSYLVNPNWKANGLLHITALTPCTLSVSLRLIYMICRIV